MVGGRGRKEAVVVYRRKSLVLAVGGHYPVRRKCSEAMSSVEDVGER